MKEEGHIPTPDTSHITCDPRFKDKVYDPSEDTFLFLDALQSQKNFLEQLNPSICLEIGCGSGCVITFLASILGPNCCYMATDINNIAANAAIETAKKNNISLDVINTDLLNHLIPRINKKVDVLLFNPPYVPTSEEEYLESIQIEGNDMLSAAWAGGIDGRQVLDRLLPFIKEVISEKGCFYLVVVDENKPRDIARILLKDGFTGQVVKKRTARNETLSILRFDRKKVSI